MESTKPLGKGAKSQFREIVNLERSVAKLIAIPSERFGPVPVLKHLNLVLRISHRVDGKVLMSDRG
eukprot:SAG31_NODE_1169_length_9565_cov_3.703571_2_plen_66_part_00